ncbi:glycosyltransferase [Pseudorhodoferax sp. Leaf267]|uniref:glycosyltransferase n=1 Tax=Pseudorhodoferax sp. Leaf267 TaxID=1736316 RepID=UPI00070141E3|nr:glycosyltransferase [Pseudorhodoferax sp. Leaf267]KQP18809.1 hypothetical protein ASF43_29220 [Pseudorhodoferax sp. Leaf267]
MSHIVHATECLAAGTLAFLAQATRALVEQDVDQVLLFARREDTPPGYAAMFHPRVRLQELPSARDSLPAFCSALGQALRSQARDPQCRAIHLHSSRAGFVGRLALAGVRQGPPILYSPHGLAYLDRRMWLPSMAFHALEWLAARVPATMVGCSASEAALLKTLSGNPTRVLENPVDPAFLALQALPAERPTVVTIGRICYQKAPEAFAALATRFRIAEHPARFIWVGSGDARRTAELRAAGVEVTGWLDAAGVRGMLATASVYVQTSRWEGMPLAVLQALAAGVPCVVTDVVGSRDAVRHGITGFVMRHFDAMIAGVSRLLEDPAMRGQFSRAARRDAAERFAPDVFGAALAGLYSLGWRQRMRERRAVPRGHERRAAPRVPALQLPVG